MQSNSRPPNDPVSEPIAIPTAERRRRTIAPASLGVCLFAASVGLAILLLQLYVFQGDPVATDENAYLFQARIFAEGRLWAPAPAEGTRLDFFFSMINFTEERWFSRYPFGHPLALAPGVLIGYPYLVPLLMGLASVLVTRAFARRVYDDATATVAVLLLGSSPFFLAMHATLLSHTTGLLALSLFALTCLKAFDSTQYRWGLLAGAFAGFALNTRPFTAVLMVWPFLAWGVWRWARSRSATLRNQLGCISIVGVLFVGAYFFYNWALTGMWWVTPYALYNPTERLGFVFVDMTEIQHTPRAGIENTLDGLSSLSHWWLGLPALCGLLVLLPFQRLKWVDVALLLSGISVVVGHFFFYFYGIGAVGPVYYFETLFPLSLLGARCVMVAWESQRLRLVGTVALGRAAVVCCIPIWILSLGGFWWHRVPTLHDELAPQRHFEAVVANRVDRSALVFVEGRTIPEWRAVGYDPFAASRDVVYMWTEGNEEHLAVMELYPKRHAYYYYGEELKRLR